MSKIEDTNEEELTRILAYAGLVLLAFELIKSLIIAPIKSFYKNSSFGKGMPFKSYKEDVMSRHKNEFEACLLYLRDFMEAINDEDFVAIQILRKHRNELAHNLPDMLSKIKIESYQTTFEKANKAFFKLSNYRMYMEIGSDPEFQSKGIDWDSIVGEEFILLEKVLDKVKILQMNNGTL